MHFSDWMLFFLLSVHGKFTEWSQWSFCSRTCGSGRRVRTRSCTHPAPRLGGKDCKGITIMHDDCQELPCGGKLLLSYKLFYIPI